MITSTKKYDVFAWIIAVISSCDTWQQLETADNLIDLFFKRHKDLRLTQRLYSKSCSKLEELIL